MKKGQIQMFETMAVMIVFFFIIAFGLTFYFFIAKAGAQRELQRHQQAQAIMSAQRLSTLPELDCSEGDVRELRCIDLWKARALRTMLTSQELRDYYWDIFGYTNLRIREVYPPGADIEVYDYPREQDRGRTFIQVPMLVYRPTEGNYTFGVMEVTYYD